MTVTQTVEIPARKSKTIEFIDTSKEEVMAAGEEILNKHISAFEELANFSDIIEEYHPALEELAK